jgi:hypothetical protein
MRSLEIVDALRAAEPIPRASRKLCGRYQAASRFGSRNSMSLGGRCVRRSSLSAGREAEMQDRSRVKGQSRMNAWLTN